MTTPSSPQISVIVCTFNRCEMLRQTLHSILSQELDGRLQLELIVVDNNSTDQTRTVVQGIAAQAPWPVTYCFEPTPGLSRARNLGVREALGTWVLFTDDDIAPNPRWVSSVYNAFQREQADGVCGPILPLWESSPPSWVMPLSQGPFSMTYGEETFLITSRRHPFFGANMAYRRQTLLQLGGFRNDLGLCGSRRLLGEDTEFFQRAVDAGKRLVYEPEAAVSHYVRRVQLTRSYFRHWKYLEGYSIARYHAPSSPTRRLVFGIPLWALREAVVGGCLVAKSYLFAGLEEAFRQELKWWVHLGYARGLGEVARQERTGARA